MCKPPQEQTRNSTIDPDAAAALAAVSPPAWAVVLPAGAVLCSPSDLQEHLRNPESRSNTAACSTPGTTDVEKEGVEDRETDVGAGVGAISRSTEGLPPSPSSCSGADDSAAESRTGSVVSAIDKAFVFDHVYPGVGTGGDSGGVANPGGDSHGDGPGSRTITVVLYGAIGSPAMIGFHDVLKEAVGTGCGVRAGVATEGTGEEDGGDGENCTVRYVFRHALPYTLTPASDTCARGDDDGDACSNGNADESVSSATRDATATKATTPLQGYGVVLDVKNMEYKNYDPSATPTEGGSGDGDGSGEGEGARDDDGLSLIEGEEIGGVVLSTLVSRRPELRRELGMLRQALLEEAGSGGGQSEELKVRTTVEYRTEKKKFDSMISKYRRKKRRCRYFFRYAGNDPIRIDT